MSSPVVSTYYAEMNKRGLGCSGGGRLREETGLLLNITPTRAQPFN